MDTLTVYAIKAMLHRLTQAGSLRLVCFGINQWAQSQRETKLKHRQTTTQFSPRSAFDLHLNLKSSSKLDLKLSDWEGSETSLLPQAIFQS